jgi:hypothetical protein
LITTTSFFGELVGASTKPNESFSSLESSSLTQGWKIYKAATAPPNTSINEINPATDFAELALGFFS